MDISIPQTQPGHDSALSLKSSPCFSFSQQGVKGSDSDFCNREHSGVQGCFPR